MVNMVLHGATAGVVVWGRYWINPALKYHRLIKTLTNKLAFTNEAQDNNVNNGSYVRVAKY